RQYKKQSAYLDYVQWLYLEQLEQVKEVLQIPYVQPYYLLGFRKEYMAAVHASMLFITLLLSLCKESFEAGGWTEDRDPDRPQNNAIAQYAYVHKRPRTGNGQRLRFLVTQARRKVVQGTGIMFNVGFIVFHGDKMLEKCITTAVMPPPRRPQSRTAGTYVSITRLKKRELAECRHILKQ
ncbi:hypothetical protein MTO96_036712, partial [Rhipicephalus appendiculatus]